VSTQLTMVVDWLARWTDRRLYPRRLVYWGLSSVFSPGLMVLGHDASQSPLAASRLPPASSAFLPFAGGFWWLLVGCWWALQSIYLAAKAARSTRLRTSHCIDNMEVRLLKKMGCPQNSFATRSPQGRFRRPGPAPTADESG
jgi:hypothetical protein